MGKMQRTRIVYQTQANGPVLGYTRESGVRILESDGQYFKNLSRSGHLEKFEDWRLSASERAADLAARLSVREMAGLMAWSCMIHVPNKNQMALHSRMHTYGGKLFEESGMDEGALSDQLLAAMREDGMRHFFLGSCVSGGALAEWNNRMQAAAEALPYGIPCIKGTDPRHGKVNISKAMTGKGEHFSVWAEGIGLAATADTDLAFQYGKTVAREYRALGIQCILGPQIDLATDPRWARYADTFGPNAELATAFAKAVTDGYQTSEGAAEVENGWGYDSICAIVKHWPGGGTGEGGRDAHYALGKYAVYPGNGFKRHLKPFADGAFQLDGPTKKAGGVMPYYTISSNIDQTYGENVGNGFSKYIVKDLLCGKYQYDGIVCSDWEIVTDAPDAPDAFAGKCWGMETQTPPERIAKAIQVGVNQLGGVDSSKDIVTAFDILSESVGEGGALALYRESTRKILENMFRLGMFENPYVEIEKSLDVVGCGVFCRLGKEEQKKSLVLLKNKDTVLPFAPKAIVYMPYDLGKAQKAGENGAEREKMIPNPETEFQIAVASELESRGLRVTDDATQADCGLVILKEPSPLGMEPGPFGRLKAGYDGKDVQNGGNGYLPISLQYRPYQAKKAREISLMGDDCNGVRENRSYMGKTAWNEERGLDALEETKRLLKDKPLVVVLNTGRPVVVSEFEPLAHAMIVDSGVEADVLADVLSGRSVPGGKLPYTMPSDMEMVECHCEDADDLTPYTDSEGNSYAFGFGLGTYQ